MCLLALQQVQALRLGSHCVRVCMHRHTCMRCAYSAIKEQKQQQWSHAANHRPMYIS